MLPKEGHLLQLVGPIRKIRRNRLVGLEHSPIREHPRAVKRRRTAPRLKNLRESVSTAELKVTGVGHGALKASIVLVLGNK